MYIHVLYNIYIYTHTHTNIPGKKMMPSSKMLAPTWAPRNYARLFKVLRFLDQMISNDTLWWTNSLLLKMAIEIVDFPIKMVIFHCYVSSPKGIKWYQMHSICTRSQKLKNTTLGPPLAVESRGSHTLDTPAAAGKGCHCYGAIRLWLFWRTLQTFILSHQVMWGIHYNHE